MHRLTPEQRLADLEKFVARHQRLPRPRIPGECGSASWVARVRNGTVGVPAEVRERVLELTRRLPRQVGRPPAVQPVERIAQLHAFVVKHGRMPRERHPAEAALARWAARPGSTLTHEQNATLRRIRNDYLRNGRFRR